ncbi:DNA mismatch repair protein MutS, partial [Morchella snyderi]
MPHTRPASVAFASESLSRPSSQSSSYTTRSCLSATSGTSKSRKLNPYTREIEGEDDDEEEVSEEEEDEEEGVIMAVDHRGRKIGCAFYSMAEQRLSLMEDIDFPTSDCLDAYEFATPYHISIRPTAEFSYDTARSKLISIRIGESNGPSITIQTPGDLHDISAGSRRRGNLLRLSGWINVESKVTVGCAGAVLTYLQRKASIDGGPGEGDGGGILVAEIEMWSMADVMFVNADTICSLQIFEDESHPNFHMQGPKGRGKEGLSLFGIMNGTRSPLGHVMLKQWFLRPSLSLSILTSRHDTLTAFLHPSNSHVLITLGKSLRNIKNIPKVLSGLRRGLGSGGHGGEWISLAKFSFYALKIRSSLQEMCGVRGLAIYKKLMDSVDVKAIQAVGQRIHDIIDFDESALQHRVVVRRNVDEELDRMKQMYDGMDSMLSQVARQVAAGIPADVAISLNVIYFPQLGYLIVVPTLEGSSNDGGEDDAAGRPVYMGQDWEFQFCTGTSWYYKNPQMREMDAYFGDMYGLICDREIELVHELQVRVLKYDEILADCAIVLAELDCLLALALAAEKYKYSRPTVTDQNVIKITKGRHPLQELCVSSYVENDCNMLGGKGSDEAESIDTGTTPDTNEATPATPRRTARPAQFCEDDPTVPSMMLITGPNYSGKSIYLKQVALIVYMAHIGSFVPAESAVIGLTDKILTRIQTRESVSKVQSAFMIDLQQIAISLRLATHRSLLVIDEFGKGTDSSDGAGL